MTDKVAPIFSVESRVPWCNHVAETKDFESIAIDPNLPHDDDKSYTQRIHVYGIFT